MWYSKPTREGDELTSVVILFALHSRMAPQALIIINQILVMLATPCKIAGASLKTSNYNLPRLLD